MDKRIEVRFLPLAGTELRLAGEGRTLEGYAAVFEQEATFWGLWREVVMPGAYAKTIGEHDIRALWNHDSNIILGRNRAGTLRLHEDSHGLYAVIAPPDNEWGRPVIDAIQRGDVTGMSLAFRAIKEEWPKPAEDSPDLPLRIIREAKLYEVSPVAFPAFEGTSISARSVALVRNEEDLLAEARAILAAHTAQAEPEAGLAHHSDPAPLPEPEAGLAHHSAEWRARELALLELLGI